MYWRTRAQLPTGHPPWPIRRSAAGAAGRGKTKGELSTAVLFEGGTRGSNPASSTGESLQTIGTAVGRHRFPRSRYSEIAGFGDSRRELQLFKLSRAPG